VIIRDETARFWWNNGLDAAFSQEIAKLILQRPRLLAGFGWNISQHFLGLY
jgi:hypothetical protein